MGLKFTVSFFVVLGFASVGWGKNHFVQLKTNSPEALTRFLESKGFEVEGYSKKSGELGVVTEFPFLLVAEQNQEIEYSISSITETESYQKYSGAQAGLDEESYLGPDESVAQLKNLEKSFPQWAKVYNLNEMLSTSKTAEGRSIYALHISLAPSKIEDKAKVLILGQHHARELMTQHAVIDSARELLERATRGEATALKAVENLSIWFVPVLNPDGLNYVLTKDRMWRKNRVQNPGGTRGVDLNRNYGVKWGSCGLNSEEESSEVYKGAEADSEAEVQLNEKLNAKLHFQYSISYHSYGNEVLNPYLCGNLAESTVYHQLRDEFASLLGYGHRPASSSGEDHEYHYNKFGTLAYLLEIGDEFQPAFSVYRQDIWPVVQKVLPFVAEQALENYVHVRVIDEETGNAIPAAALNVQQINFKENEIRATDGFGSYRWRLPNGNYSVSANILGYESQSAQVSATGRVDMLLLKLKKHRGVFPRLNPFLFYDFLK